MDVYGYHQDQLHAFPSLIAVVKHFTTIFLGTDFYPPSSVKERIFAQNCLSLSLSLFFSDHRQFRRRYEVVYPHFIRRWKCGCHVEVTLSRLIIRRVTVFIGYSGFKRWHNRKAFLRDEEKGECFSRRTRYANVRDVKKRFFRFLPSFFFLGNRSKKGKIFNAEESFSFRVVGRRRTRWKGRGRFLPWFFFFFFFSIRFTHRTMLVPLGRK